MDTSTPRTEVVSEPAGDTVLTSSHCWALLRRTDLGRLALVVGASPDIFPVNYVVDRGSVVFRTASGSKLDAADGRMVALEADGTDADQGVAWSVVVKGRAGVVRGLHDSIDAAFLPLHPVHPKAKPHLVRIEATSITGRRFRTV
jgi:nitroimidazol reductase NimA-like FMN-containing flavoprotein (pyridoxamine 5'-phosphate oxidase superfamily)